MLLRACRSSLLRSSTAQRVRCLGAVSNSSTIDMNLGRTPERTAELEKLAEQHNGFLFGEVVRDALASMLLSDTFSAERAPTRARRASSPAHHFSSTLLWIRSPLQRVKVGSGRTGNIHMCL